jgi:hypothetical protein
MNGYEKHSKDYGGPPPGWATVMFAIALVAVIVGSIMLKLI